jgi:hypothetical protein
MQNGIFTLRGRAAWAHDFNPTAAIAPPSRRCRARASSSTARRRRRLRAGHRLGRNEMAERLVAAATFEGEFSNVTRSYAGKGVVRYAW